MASCAPWAFDYHRYSRQGYRVSCPSRFCQGVLGFFLATWIMSKLKIIDIYLYLAEGRLVGLRID
jgi:hypothetical protein